MKGFSAVGLENPKFSYNVGGALRSCFCFDVNLIGIQGHRIKNNITDTTKAYKNIPSIQTEDLLSLVPVGCEPVAVDLLPTARPLNNFVHPPRAFYLFGPEDGTLSKEIVDRCRYKVYIPTKICMNLAAAVNVVLYDRMVKNED